MRFALLFALAACAPDTSDCEHLKGLLSRCLGSSVSRLDCTTVTDVDVRRLTSLVETTSCEVIASALPFDGNLQSATCRMVNVGCVEPATPAPTPGATRFPVLLVNGIDTSPLFRYSDRIVSTLRDAGHSVHLATLTPFEPPVRRAPELWAIIQRVRAETGALRVNLICHSLGGLDCRYLASPNGLGLDLGEQGIPQALASITTVGTAHRGTRAADAMLGLLGDVDANQAIDDFASIAGDWFSPDALARDVHLRDALNALTTTQARAFNAEVVDAPGLFYQSFAGISHPLGESTHALDTRIQALCAPDVPSAAVTASTALDDLALTLVPFVDLVGLEDGAALPHDGLITVPSAKWGVFRGCVPADHMEQLGQRNLPDVNVRNGVDIARFYAAIAADLAQRGY